MKFSLLLSALAAITQAKRILLTNDDSFVANNIRAAYVSLKDAGHDVYLVAPVSQRSGWSGKFDIPYTTTLLTNGEFGYVKAGEPAWGHEPNDDHIWYFNGTPASSVAFGLDYVLPVHFNLSGVDLVVSGPNQGLNLSPGLFTISGTIGAAYNAVYRGVPAIAFSGSNGNNTFYEDSDLNDPQNPSVIYAAKVVQIVNQLFKSQGDNPRALPLSIGISVNLPKVGSQSTTGCNDPSWVATRLTGAKASGPSLAFNETSGLFSWKDRESNALSNRISGSVVVPSESEVLASGCRSSVSFFSIDYDAPYWVTEQTKPLLGSLFG